MKEKLIEVKSKSNCSVILEKLSERPPKGCTNKRRELNLSSYGYMPKQLMKKLGAVPFEANVGDWYAVEIVEEE